MRFPTRAFVVAMLAGSMAACSDYTGPAGSTLYLLRRVGSQPLPAPADPGPQASLYIADSLFVPGPREHDKDPFILTRTTVLQSFSGERNRSVGQFQATAAANYLTIDSCPIGSFCIASLVYAPITFHIVGDSLFEQIPSGSPYQPRVYSRARH